MRQNVIACDTIRTVTAFGLFLVFSLIVHTVGCDDTDVDQFGDDDDVLAVTK